MEDKKPRVRFCWECGRKLCGNHYEEVEIPPDNIAVIMHKQCAKEYKNKNK